VIAGISTTARTSGGGFFSCSLAGHARPGISGLAILALTGLLFGRRRKRR